MLALVAFAVFTAVPEGFAQMGPAARMGIYGGGPGAGMYAGGYGMGSMGNLGGPGGVGGQQAAVLVKSGKIVYCAVFNDLLEYDVQFFRVGANQLENYYDDGTHGDEVANDGIASNIEIITDEYLGPFAIQYKERLELALERIKIDSNGLEIQDWPLQFYGISVAEVPITVKSVMDKDVAPEEEIDGLLPENRVPRYEFIQENLQEQIDDLQERLLTDFYRPDGSPYDEEKYRKNVDITRLEASLEFGNELQTGGMGGGGGFGGGGGPVGAGMIGLERARNLGGGGGAGAGGGGS